MPCTHPTSLTLPTLAFALVLVASGCPRRTPVPELPRTATAPEGELEALIATERALQREQGEQLWALWVRGTPGGVARSYERFPLLSSPATLERLRALEALFPAQKTALQGLERTLVATYLARTTEEVDQRIARLLTTATFELDGTPLAWRELGPRLARESDLRRRQQLQEALDEVESRHLLLLKERATLVEQAAVVLGRSSTELRDRLLPAPIELLLQISRRTLEQDAASFGEALEKQARSRMGKARAALPATALARLFAPEPGEEVSLPPEGLLDDLDRLLARVAPEGPGLAGAASTLATGEDERQAPLPLCLPVAPPADLRLAVAPRAGLRARLDALHEATVCTALGETRPAGEAHRAAARAHEAQHLALTALRDRSLSLPSLPEALARSGAERELLRMAAEARREAALLISVLEPPPPEGDEDALLQRHQALLHRALGLSPSPEATLRWERAWAEAHLPTLAARVLARGQAHGFDVAPIQSFSPRPSDALRLAVRAGNSEFDRARTLKE